MANPTIDKFGYPDTLIKEYQHWVVLLRPSQVTLGSLILAAKSSATAYSHIPASAFAEQAIVIAEIERALSTFCSYEKINYLMLMMVDPHVHFHVIPRYEGLREFSGLALEDFGWPGPPALKDGVPLDANQIHAMRDELIALFQETNLS
jgi:diadenosine tetraphosphate (Ap4A) HIT family hydrolase